MIYNIEHTTLFEKGHKLFINLGINPLASYDVMTSLIETSLRGIDSHGINLIPRYVRELKEGKISLTNSPKVILQNDIFTNISGEKSFGQIAANFGIKIGIKKAKEKGISVVGLSSNHIGALGQYNLKAAEDGLICFSICNAGPNVAPHGGNKRFIGTNPISFAIPTKNNPILVDFATSIYPENKVREYRDKNLKLPSNIILDPLGNPTNDPHKFYEGGSLLPIGAHKGYGLGISAIILGSIFTGAGFWALDKNSTSNGTTFILFDPKTFTGDKFFDDISKFINELKSQPTIEGIKEILLPGEKEEKIKKERLLKGIPVKEDLIKILKI